MCLSHHTSFARFDIRLTCECDGHFHPVIDLPFDVKSLVLGCNKGLPIDEPGSMFYIVYSSIYRNGIKQSNIIQKIKKYYLLLNKGNIIKKKTYYQHLS